VKSELSSLERSVADFESILLGKQGITYLFVTVQTSAVREWIMTKVSCRECYFIKATGANIDYVIRRVKSAIEEVGVPPKYHINVYKNVYACCGVSGSGIIVEITGPEEEKIRSLDLKAVSKILEICEKEGIEHHAFEPLDIG